VKFVIAISTVQQIVSMVPAFEPASGIMVVSQQDVVIAATEKGVVSLTAGHDIIPRAAVE
jgi:hypothetical protein